MFMLNLYLVEFYVIVKENVINVLIYVFCGPVVVDGGVMGKRGTWEERRCRR